MGGGHELGDRVCGADIPRGPGGSRAAGEGVWGHLGHGSLQCVQLVPSAMAAAVLGAFAAGFCSDAGPWWALRGDRFRLTGAGAPDVYVVASGARGHAETSDVSVLHDPASPRGRAIIGSGQPMWCAQDRRDVSGYPEAA